MSELLGRVVDHAHGALELLLGAADGRRQFRERQLADHAEVDIASGLFSALGNRTKDESDCNATLEGS